MPPSEHSYYSPPEGRWQLTLRELLLSSWVTGLLMLIASAICPQELRTVGIIFGLLLGLYFTATVLINARRGHELSFMRIIAALGVILIVGGVATSLMSLNELETVHRQHVNSVDAAFNEPSHGWGWLVLAGVMSSITGCAFVWFTAGYLAAPKRSQCGAEETLHRLLEVKKTTEP